MFINYIKLIINNFIFIIIINITINTDIKLIILDNISSGFFSINNEVMNMFIIENINGII
jgi:hypothetical protein